MRQSATIVLLVRSIAGLGTRPASRNCRSAIAVRRHRPTLDRSVGLCRGALGCIRCSGCGRLCPVALGRRQGRLALTVWSPREASGARARPPGLWCSPAVRCRWSSRPPIVSDKGAVFNGDVYSSGNGDVEYWWGLSFENGGGGTSHAHGDRRGPEAGGGVHPIPAPQPEHDLRADAVRQGLPGEPAQRGLQQADRLPDPARRRPVGHRLPDQQRDQHHGCGRQQQDPDPRHFQRMPSGPRGRRTAPSSWSRAP